MKWRQKEQYKWSMKQKVDFLKDKWDWLTKRNKEKIQIKIRNEKGDIRADTWRSSENILRTDIPINQKI
jgi:hypothetical protein